jgi:hypothetical protein
MLHDQAGDEDLEGFDEQEKQLNCITFDITVKSGAFRKKETRILAVSVGHRLNSSRY